MRPFSVHTEKVIIFLIPNEGDSTKGSSPFDGDLKGRRFVALNDLAHEVAIAGKLHEDLVRRRNRPASVHRIEEITTIQLLHIHATVGKIRRAVIGTGESAETVIQTKGDLPRTIRIVAFEFRNLRTVNPRVFG